MGWPEGGSYAFDSDTRDPKKSGPTGPKAALVKLSQYLELRSAEVFVAAVPDGPDGKWGIDDFLGSRGVV